MVIQLGCISAQACLVSFGQKGKPHLVRCSDVECGRFEVRPTFLPVLGSLLQLQLKIFINAQPSSQTVRVSAPSGGEGASDAPQHSSQTSQNRRLQSPLSSGSRLRLVLCETQEEEYKCAEGGRKVALTKDGGLLRKEINIWTIYHNALHGLQRLQTFPRALGRPRGGCPWRGKPGVGQAEPGDAGELGACKASVARVPPARPNLRMW